MNLLTAIQTNDMSFKKETEQLRRIKAINDQENEATRNFNQTKTTCEAEEARIKADLAAFEETASLRKKELTNEVLSLEERRAEAMKPIHEIRKEAEESLAAVTAKASNLTIREEAIVKAEREIVERMLAVTEKEDAIEDTIDGLNKREERIASEEETLKLSAGNLSSKWFEYHAIAHELNRDRLKLDKERDAQQSANKAVRDGLEAFKEELNKERIALIDAYAALAKAKEEILGHK